MKLRLTKKKKAIRVFEFWLAISSLTMTFVPFLVFLTAMDHDIIFRNSVTDKVGDSINYFYQSRTVFTGYYFTFFTIQTNFLCIFLLFLAGCMPLWKGKVKILQSKFITTVAAYIAITGIGFDTLLLFTFIDSAPTPFAWASLIWEHNVLPIGFIFWAWTCIPPMVQISKKTWSKRVLPIAFIYPLVYMILMVAQGVDIYYRARDLQIDGHSVFYHGIVCHNGKTHNFNNAFFHYYLLNVLDYNYSVPGPVWLLIILTVNSSVLVGFSYLGFKIHNHRFARPKSDPALTGSPVQQQKLTDLSQKLN